MFERPPIGTDSASFARVSNDLDALRDHLLGGLRAAGWEENARSKTSFTFCSGRRLVSIATKTTGVIQWTVFPTPPKLPPNVLTKPNPIPVGTFTIEGDATHASVTSHVLDRNGRIVAEPLCAGDARAVFQRLFEESTRRVDEFVRTVEKAP